MRALPPGRGARRAPEGVMQACQVEVDFAFPYGEGCTVELLLPDVVSYLIQAAGATIPLSL